MRLQDPACDGLDQQRRLGNAHGPVTYPAPECLTFQSRAIMVAYSSLSTG